MNYDVEIFREKQRESEQEGAVGYAFGSLFGNMMQSSGQDYSSQGQKNRFDFYDRLTDFLEESYWDAAAAEAAFDGANLYCRELGALQTEAELFAYRELLEEADGSMYESRREEILNALARYMFDLNCAYLIFSSTLTENEVPFLDEMRHEVGAGCDSLSCGDRIRIFQPGRYCDDIGERKSPGRGYLGIPFL